MSIKFIKKGEADYPLLLTEIADPPAGLFWRGEVFGGTMLAIVGSRKATNYGLEAVDKLISQLSGTDVVIVSGLAFGIDASAHRSALKYGLKTIAVLPSGVDKPYPRAHHNLAEQILAGGGALVSEYPLGTVPQKYHFPVRNRIVVGMSKAVLLVEAGEKSGTLISARLATEYNRDVLAVPGSIFSEVSAGTNRLISEGARLVASGDSIKEELGIEKSVTLGKAVELEPFEQKIFKEIKAGSGAVNDLVESLAVLPHKLAPVLTTLEIKGMIRKVGNEYVAN